MNTHDIDLPDLPPCFEVLTDRTHTEIRAYARAAIEADRKQHDRMLAHEWIRPALGLSEDAPYRFDFYAQQIEGMKADRKHKGEVVVTKTPEGEIIAVTRQDDEGRILSVIAEAESKRRGEPVHLFRRRGQPSGDFVTCSLERYAELSAMQDKFDTMIAYTAPQPAEPDRGAPVPKGWKLVPETPTSKQIVHMALQIKGADSDGWFRTDGDDWHQHVDAAERAYKWALSEAPQPAEPVHETARTAGNGAESGVNTGPQGGEHSASSYSSCGCNSDDCRVNGCLSLRQAQSDMAPGGGGMPAEPVKVPSDADAKHIQDFIACDGMGAVIVEGPQYSAVVRALLARYSHLTAPTHKSSNQNRLIEDLDLVYGDNKPIATVITHNNHKLLSFDPGALDELPEGTILYAKK